MTCVVLICGVAAHRYADTTDVTVKGKPQKAITDIGKIPSGAVVRYLQGAEGL